MCRPGSTPGLAGLRRQGKNVLRLHSRPAQLSRKALTGVSLHAAGQPAYVPARTSGAMMLLLWHGTCMLLHLPKQAFRVGFWRHPGCAALCG